MHLMASGLGVLVCVVAVLSQTAPDSFNVRAMEPLLEVSMPDDENLRRVRLVTRKSTLAHGDSSLNEPIWPGGAPSYTTKRAIPDTTC